jgi:hypothetical protein
MMITGRLWGNKTAIYLAFGTNGATSAIVSSQYSCKVVPKLGGVWFMNLDEFEAQIALLLTKMEDQPENRHEVYFMISERLNELRATGMPVPEDLLKLEAALDEEFAAENSE